MSSPIRQEAESSRFPVAVTITGKVLTEDSLPVTNARAQLQCGSATTSKSSVGSNGDFSLTLRLRADGRPVSECEVQVVASGFHSEVRALSSLHPAASVNVGNVVLHPIVDAKGAVISVNSLKAPSDANRAFEKGLDALKEQHLPEAQKQFENAIKLYPVYAEAWQQVGELHQRSHDDARAKDAFERAIAADPAFLRPYFALIAMAADAHNWSEVKKVSDAALQHAVVPLMLFYNGVADFNLQQPDEAEKVLLRAEQLDANHQVPDVELLLSEIYSSRNDNAAAAARLREYLKIAPEGPDSAKVRAKLQQLEQTATAQ